MKDEDLMTWEEACDEAGWKKDTLHDQIPQKISKRTRKNPASSKGKPPEKSKRARKRSSS